MAFANYGTAILLDSGPGDDTIINHGRVEFEIFGNKGDDVIYNSGMVGSYIVGEGGSATVASGTLNLAGTLQSDSFSVEGG